MLRCFALMLLFCSVGLWANCLQPKPECPKIWQTASVALHHVSTAPEDNRLQIVWGQTQDFKSPYMWDMHVLLAMEGPYKIKISPNKLLHASAVILDHVLPQVPHAVCDSQQHLWYCYYLTDYQNLLVYLTGSGYPWQL